MVDFDEASDNKMCTKKAIIRPDGYLLLVGLVMRYH